MGGSRRVGFLARTSSQLEMLKLSEASRDRVFYTEKKMNEIKFHRITDWNGSVYGLVVDGLNKYTSFEAGFSISEEKALFLHWRAIDSNGGEIFRNTDMRAFVLRCNKLERYQEWNPEADLEAFINAIDLQIVEEEPVYFQAPFLELTIEVKGPIANPQVFGTTISMAMGITILDRYEWQDSAYISIGMLCRKENLLEFARGLKADLLELRSQ